MDPQRLHPIGPLPRKALPLAAEVAEGSGGRVDRPPQIEVADDAGRGQVEHLPHGLLETCLGHFRGTVRVDPDRHRVGSSDRVGELHRGAPGQSCGDQIFCHPAGRVGRGAVDLGRILA